MKYLIFLYIVFVSCNNEKVKATSKPTQGPLTEEKELLKNNKKSEKVKFQLSIDYGHENFTVMFTDSQSLSIYRRPWSTDVLIRNKDYSSLIKKISKDYANYKSEEGFIEVNVHSLGSPHKTFSVKEDIFLESIFSENFKGVQYWKQDMLPERFLGQPKIENQSIGIKKNP